MDLNDDLLSWKLHGDNGRFAGNGSSAPKKANNLASLSRMQSPMQSPKLQAIGSPRVGGKKFNLLHSKWSGGLGGFGGDAPSGLGNSTPVTPLSENPPSLGDMGGSNVMSGGLTASENLASLLNSSDSNTSSLQNKLSGNEANNEGVGANPSSNTSVASTTPVPQPTEDTIPTAIVIKNIPFSLEKDSLIECFKKLGIPKPYAFNYHYDNGVFRGLAFANFYMPEEARAVVQALNGYEINGRRLRVEWKRQLPAAEREKLERGKKRVAEERRKQQQTKQYCYNFSAYGLDMNDPATLEVYTRILLFMNQRPPARELVLEAGSEDTRMLNIIRVFCLHLDLEYYAVPNGETCKLVVSSPAKHSTTTTTTSQSQPPSPRMRSISAHNPIASRFMQEHVVQGIQSAPATPPPSLELSLAQLGLDNDLAGAEDFGLFKARTKSALSEMNGNPLANVSSIWR
ncbi:RNA-binding protein Cip1 [Schizosaccharomyces japonicus yFS275]|uniref:RNA-binding protein Cip1 n=1 Tax=Schizosaccharomyces japonicus (strain yFS275 / FY16936) TaxID=402676 RepID=B6K6P8_SCHJY|nr:RNA-binding protein Cip1 [Schizosaccharomyces japonicus yFS275]EEB09202.1 RNA-binding protein Cip1 [Schizosaccharomyces japonicus yFS275]